MFTFLFIFDYSTYELRAVYNIGKSNSARIKSINVGGSVRGLGLHVIAPSEEEARKYNLENPKF